MSDIHGLIIIIIFNEEIYTEIEKPVSLYTRCDSQTHTHLRIVMPALKRASLYSKVLTNVEELTPLESPTIHGSGRGLFRVT